MRAFDLLRAGGRLVYSTCTFAPEENESVVSRLLGRRSEAQAVPVPLPFAHAPALAAWQGVAFEPGTELGARIYPHHLDSGGGFVACIERVS